MKILYQLIKLKMKNGKILKHIVISYLNEYYDEGNEFIINKKTDLDDKKLWRN